MEGWTDSITIEIEGIPKKKALKIAKVIGNILLSEGCKFDHGGIGLANTGIVTGIIFQVEQEEK